MKKLSLCLLLSLTLTACGPKKFIPLSPTAQQNIKSCNVHTLRARESMKAVVEEVSASGGAAGAGLFGAVALGLFAGSINANRRDTATKALNPLQDYMRDIDVNATFQTKIHPVLQNTPWLKVHKIYNEKTLNAQRLTQLYMTSPVDTILTADFDYVMAKDFDEMRGKLILTLYAAAGSSPATKPGKVLFRTERDSVVKLTGATRNISQNAALWEARGQAHFNHALGTLVDLAVNEVDCDLQNPGQMR